MELPKITDMQNDFSVIIKNLQSLIDSLIAKDDLYYEEYSAQFGSIVSEIISLETKMNGFSALTANQPNSKISKQFSSAYKELWKTRKKLRLGYSKIEKKYLSDKLNRIFSWEHAYKTTKMRSEMTTELKAGLKDLLKIQEKIKIK